MGDNRFNELFEAADNEFNNNYKKELDELKETHKTGINLPETSQAYADLIKVVENASKKNLSRSELAQKIKVLGDIAVKVAKKHFKL